MKRGFDNLKEIQTDYRDLTGGVMGRRIPAALSEIDAGDKANLRIQDAIDYIYELETAIIMLRGWETD